MKRTTRHFGIAAALAAGALGVSAGPAVAAGQGRGVGATTVECAKVFPYLGGTIAFTPSGQLLGNCWQHEPSPGGGSRGGSAEIVDCEDELEQPGWVGIAVHTPEGSTYINCHVHVNAGQP